MVIAQAITGYGILAGLMASAVSTFDRVADSLGNLGTPAWILIFAGLFLLYVVVGRPN